MSHRADNATNHPHGPRRLALVDADVNQHHCVREYFAGPEVGWHVDTYPTTQTAWSGLASAPPCVVLMDVAPPTATGLGCLRNLRARLPDVPVVVYTAQDCAGMLLQSLTAGARGYLIKPLPPADLLPHLHKVLGGGVAFCPQAERLLLEAFALMRQRPVNPWGLTRREEDILAALCAHKTEKDIGVELGIETGTVHVHLMKIYKKLAVHDRASAIRIYLAAMRGGGKPTRELAQQRLSLYTIFIPSGGLPFRYTPAQMSTSNELGQATMRDAEIIGKLARERESSVQRSLCSPLEKHGAVTNVSIPRTAPLPARAATPITAIYLVLRLSALCSVAEPLPQGWWQQSAAETALAKAESITDALLYFRGTKAHLLNDPNASVALFQRRTANDAIERKSVSYKGGKTLSTVYELESGKYFYARGRLIRCAFKDDLTEPTLAATLDHAYDYKFLPSETIGTNDCVVVARVATAQLIQMLRAAFYPGYPYGNGSLEDPIKYIRAERVTYMRKNDGVIVGEVEKNNRGEVLKDTLYDVVVVNSPIPSEEFDLPKTPVQTATNTVQLMRMVSKGGYSERTPGARRIRVAIIGAMVIFAGALLALLYFRMHRGNVNFKGHATR